MAYGQSTPLNPSLVTAHSQVLSGLTAGQTYHYRVKSKDGAGNETVSGDFTFTTGSVVISNVASGGITTSGATITWTTNVNSDSQVEYGVDTSYGQLAPATPNPALVTAHSQALSGLTAGQVYHYRVRSRDTAGNLAVSGDFSFTTTQSGSIPLDGLASLSYNTANNRITTAGFEYDPAGNQTRAVINASGTQHQYRYDCAGRLAQVLDASGNVLASYSYGAGNQRLMSVEGGVTKYFAWAGERIIAEYEAFGSNALQWKMSYVYLGGNLLATTSGSSGTETRFHHPDRLGTRLVTDSLGDVVSEQLNLPFGTMLPFTQTYGGENSYQHPTLSNPSKKRFTSYDRSDMTGLDYAVNRFYSAQQGRFTQVDPIDMDAVELEDPQTLNMYTYCGNDSINHRDPDGLFFGKLWRGIKNFFNSTIGKIAAAVALTVLSLGLLGPLTFQPIVGSISLGGGASIAVVGATQLTALGWAAVGLSVVSGMSLPNGFAVGGFRTPGINPGAVETYIRPQRGGGGRNVRRNNPPRPLTTLPRRGGREQRSHGRLEVGAPSFPNLKDHARRHGGGMTPEQYYNVARTQVDNWNMGVTRWESFRKSGPSMFKTVRIRAYHDGQFKWYYITRVGPDNFIFTSTTLRGNVILTHMRDKLVGGNEVMNTREFIKKGVIFPPGF